MNRIRKATVGAIVAASVIGVGIVGVSAANAAAPADADHADQQAGTLSSSGSVSVGEDGTVTTSGDVVPADPADIPAWDAETERKIAELSAQYPDGAMISIDENGDVTAQPLPASGSGSFTNSAPAED